MSERYTPVGADGTRRTPEPSSQFMMRCLLASRLELGYSSDADPGEQEVNIYLTNLLCAYCDPHYCLRVGGYISTYDSTVFERAQHSPSHRFKYTVYKVNADHLLMSIGVFQNPAGRRPNAQPAALQRDAGIFVGRAKTYYDFAATYGQRLFGQASGVCSVLDKLSADFETYVAMLTHLRGEYFDLVAPLGDGALYHLQRAAQAEGAKALHDELLDRYSDYRRDPNPEARARLIEVASRLRQIDPDFRLDLQ